MLGLGIGLASPSVLGGGSTLLNDLVAFWKLGEASGSRVDSSGNGHTMTETSATLNSATGKIGNAVDFTGVSADYLESNNTIGRMQTATTVSCWFYVDTAVGNDTLFGTWLATGNQRSWYVQPRASGTLWQLNVSDDGASSTDVQNFSATYTHETWYHLVLTYDGTKFEMYQNGSKLTGDLTVDPFSSTGKFELGNINASGAGLDGRIDATGIWSRVLTSDEITELYNAGSGVEYPF